MRSAPSMSVVLFGLLVAACGSDRPRRAAPLGDSLGVHRNALSLDPSIPALDFDQSSAGGKTIALTFDDGPDATYCATVLDALKAAGVPATFFINTNNFLDVSTSTYGARLVQRMFAEGHQIGNHSDHHYDFANIPLSAVTTELDTTYQLMKSIVPDALQVRLARAPYGDPYFGPQTSLDQVAPIVARYGVHVGWNIDALDFDCTSTSCVVSNVLGAVDAGLSGLVLMHCPAPYTGAALPAILAGLQARGMRFALVEELVLAKYGIPSRDLIFCSSDADCVAGESCGVGGHCAPTGATSDAGSDGSVSSDAGSDGSVNSDAGSDGSVSSDVGVDAADGSSTDAATGSGLVYCSTLTLDTGALAGAYQTACGPSGALASDDGTTVVWSASSTSTKTSADATFALPRVPRSLALEVTYVGDGAPTAPWYWSAWDPTERAWDIVEDDHWAVAGVSTAHDIMIEGPAGYVDASGVLRIRLATQSSHRAATLDRMVVRLGP